MAGRLFHFLCRSAGRRGQQWSGFQCLKNFNNRPDNGRFTRSRAAGNNHDFFPAGLFHRLYLLSRKNHGQFPLNPFYGFFRINFPGDLSTFYQPFKKRPRPCLTSVKNGKINHPVIFRIDFGGRFEGINYDFPGFGQFIHGAGNIRLADLQQGHAFPHQRLIRIIHMSLISQLIQQIQHPGPNPWRAVSCKADLSGDFIRNDKSDTNNITGQLIGRRRYHLYCTTAISADNFNGVTDADAMTL